MHFFLLNKKTHTANIFFHWNDSTVPIIVNDSPILYPLRSPTEISVSQTPFRTPQSLCKPSVNRTVPTKFIMQLDLSRLLTQTTLIIGSLLAVTVLSSVPFVLANEFDVQIGASLAAAFPQDADHRIARGRMTSRSNRMHLYVSHCSQ